MNYQGGTPSSCPDPEVNAVRGGYGGNAGGISGSNDYILDACFTVNVFPVGDASQARYGGKGGAGIGTGGASQGLPGGRNGGNWGGGGGGTGSGSTSTTGAGGQGRGRIEWFFAPPVINLSLIHI